MLKDEIKKKTKLKKKTSSQHVKPAIQIMRLE
jgi:hypothetical protein